MDPGLREVKDRLYMSRSPVFLTGAGVSAESGVPTFRGPEGLWRSFKPEDLATPEAFSKDPALVWEWYDWRRRLVSGILPNPAHYALAQMERKFMGLGDGRNPARKGGSFTLITQNVDGLHGLAGSRRVIELHGSIWKVRCVECGVEAWNRDVPIDIPPRCPCGGLLRPGVVWFGETLPEGALEEAFHAALNADFMLVIGTSGVVQPAASLAGMAKSGGAFVAELNVDDTPISGIMDAAVRGKAGEIMPLLLED